MKHPDVELIGTVNYLTSKYGVYRQPGKPEDLKPYYFGIALLHHAAPYCAYSSLDSALRTKAMRARVRFLDTYTPTEEEKRYAEL
jgi:hypothetical protein